ncbi:methyltransferase domain-containing protein, partial [uncultured Corynebacterium sp.]|uniref:methyltransferase domain-containing protein n=1 Tax=uncultured Corynebacterium sp. TaxID=159447 RepID=UPI00261A2F99
MLEPGVGAGGFIDAAPEGADVVGIERDPMSALIANARYPESQIRREDFADTSIADNSFVATIGNVP